MPSMNQINILGNLTKDPYVAENDEGRKTCSFTVAVNRRFQSPQSKDWHEERTFVDVIATGRVAEHAIKLKKGQMVLVQGHLGNKQRAVGDIKVLLLIVHAGRIQHFKTTKEMQEVAEKLEKSNKN